MSRTSAFDPNHVRYHYVSTRVIREIVAQERAGRSNWRPRGLTARAPGLSLTFGQEPDDSPSRFDLVRAAEGLLDFGTLRHPGRYIREVIELEGFETRTSEDGYRVALFRTDRLQNELLVLIGSIENVLGAIPNQGAAPHGFWPSFAGGLAPMLQLFRSDRRRRRQLDLPETESAISELVSEAASYAFDLGHDDDEGLRLLTGKYELAAEIWFEAPDVMAGSLRRGNRITYETVYVGTPLWIRDARPTPVDGD